MMNDAIAGNIDLSAVFDLYTYLDDAVVGHNYENQKLGDIIDDLHLRAQSGDSTLTADQKNCIELIRGALNEHNEWGDAVLKDRSTIDANGMPSVTWTDDSVQAATFQYGDDYYVSFRGTGDGRWTDNSMGMKEITPMQEAARGYFDSVVERFGLENSSGDIYLGGHSKGGNEAQYCMLSSKYGGLVKAVYSIDGQGFPPEVVEQLKSMYGEDEYKARLARMYSICGENDPVHQVIGPVISPENTYYLPQSGGGIVGWHDMKYLFGQEVNGKWEYTGLQWQKTGDEYDHGSPQASALFAAGLYNMLKKLDPEMRTSISKGLMGFIDLLTGTNLSDPADRATLGDYWNFLVHGVPMIGMELFFTPEGNKMLQDLILMLENSMVDKLGPVAGTIVTAIIVGAAEIILVPLLLTWTLLGTLFENSIVYQAFVLATTVALAVFAIALKKIIDIVKGIFDLVGNLIDGIVSFFKKHSYAYKYCNNNPGISLNTDTLESYARKLNSLNNRLQNVEYRIKRLYDQVDVLDKTWVLSADMKIGSSGKLRKSIDYLNYTASEFRNAEKSINNKIAEVFG